MGVSTVPPRAAPASTPAMAQRSEPWKEYGKATAAFLLILLGYLLSFSVDMNDALDAARWMENGQIRQLAEFRHLVQRMLPLYLWLDLRSHDLHVSAMAVLSAIDFVFAALSVMLLYRIVKDWTGSRGLAFASSFAFATAHCVWIYTGSGRLYSTSMFLAFAGYYLAWQFGNPEVKRPRYWLAFGAGTMMCFASLFWLVHAFNALAGAVMILLLPAGASVARRTKYLLVYSLTGILLTAGSAVATMKYADIPMTQPAMQEWIQATETQPMKFDWQSPMNASYGQAHGMLVMYELPYMISGLLRPDRHLAAMGSLPWQLGKFAFVWLLLLLVYVYPLFVFWRTRSSRLRILIFALYLALGLNLWFGLVWLGSDVQRFMPTMLSQFALGAIAAQHLLARTSRPRLVAGILIASVAFIAADNLIESLLPSQRRYIVLTRETSDLHPYLRPNDLMITFGRDLTINYAAMLIYHGGVRGLNLTNDDVRWHWGRPDWDVQMGQIISARWAYGGRTFVSERLVLGVNPPAAGWNERHHSRPTVAEFSHFLRGGFCVAPAFVLEGIRYWEVSARKPACARQSPLQLWPLARDGRPRCCAPLLVDTNGMPTRAQ